MLVEARSWVGEKKPISTIMISIKISLEEHWGMRAVLIGNPENCNPVQVAVKNSWFQRLDYAPLEALKLTVRSRIAQ